MSERTLRICLFSIISIFLSVPFSANGQGREGDDPLERALRWERVIYSSGDAADEYPALVSKAGCYAEASLYPDALRTLERVKMYLLDSESAVKVLYLKALYSKEAGDTGAALGFLEESGMALVHPALYSTLLASSWRFTEAREQALRLTSSDQEREAVENLFKKAPKQKKEGVAAALSFIPPAGQLYVKEPARGLLSMVLNAGAAGFTVTEILGHDWITGFLGGGLLLNETFLKGNIIRNIESVDPLNKRSVKEFSESLETLLNSFEVGVNPPS